MLLLLFPLLLVLLLLDEWMIDEKSDRKLISIDCPFRALSSIRLKEDKTESLNTLLLLTVQLIIETMVVI